MPGRRSCQHFCFWRTKRISKSHKCKLLVLTHGTPILSPLLLPATYLSGFTPTLIIGGLDYSSLGTEVCVTGLAHWEIKHKEGAK
jgi:hypothetical protein